MLLSIALILIIGFSLSGIFARFGLPGLLGMILTGILLGPFVFDLISLDILNISAELRQISLIVILVRAGLSLDLRDLKKVGRPAVLMSFIPATFEFLAVTLLAPLFFPITYLESAIMGTVLAAVSPAVIVPRMIHLIESGYGKDKKIPQLILAGASVDDIYVIVLFTSFMGMSSGSGFDVMRLGRVPVSIVLGVLLGIVAGFILVEVFRRLHIRDTVKVLIILSVSFLFMSFEEFVSPYAPVSGLLSVMALGGTILERYEVLARRLMGKFSRLWVAAEVLLFVLVGAAVDITYVGRTGLSAVALILLALVIRMVGVYLSLLGTNLTAKEKRFCAIAYLPKATVQAAIGSIPLAAGVGAGNTILSVAVLAIMITAPIGAIGIDWTYRRLLQPPPSA